MKPQPDRDPFDLEFESDDEFAPPQEEVWRGEAADPFADLPPPRPRPEPVEAVEETPRPAATGLANPVHEMISGAEAAFGEVSLPRITIHVFCETQATAELADRAAGDRRMERAVVVNRMGGLAAACELYQGQPTPSLVIVESLDAGPGLLAGLDRLAEICDPGTKVVVVGAANDIALYRELMRRGVSEYLVPPLNPLQLVRAVTGLYADPSAPFVGRQIAFCGAKGGAGASTVAHNIAHSITERLQTGAVLVDLDLPFGTAGLDFNQDPLQGVADALTQPDRLDPVLMDRMMVRCTERLSLFAAPATLDADYDIGPEAYEEVTQKIRTAAPFVVLDLPHVWSAWKRKILLSSDDLVIVATPDLASLRNAKNMVDLVRRARPNDAPPRLVLNQVGVPGRPEIPVKDFGEALGLTPALCLPFDPKLFGQAANNGQMLAEVAPKSRCVEGLDALAQQIARRDPPASPKTSLFSSLFKKK
ncbi:MAG: CpaE family protein [Phenylobacterium sp.]|uniref:AAA family ATPase n=1 Tax=Phenylobacterium sp. TaxID=1871053 RepID=UPI003918AF15